MNDTRMNDDANLVERDDVTERRIDAQRATRPAGEQPRTERGELPAANDDVTLLPDEDRDDLQTAWGRVQVGFVDEPRRAVQQAHELVGRLVDALTRSFEEQRDTLEDSWSSGADVSTEDLRLALQRYRSLFDRLLST